MKKQEIEKAIENLNSVMTKMNDMYQNNVRIKDSLCLAIECMENELENDSEKTDELIGDMGFRLADLRDENKLLKEKLKQFETSENKPLSFEELKSMIGDPVWVVEKAKDFSTWKIIQNVSTERIWATESYDSYGYEEYEDFMFEYYDFYKHKLKENNNE